MFLFKNVKLLSIITSVNVVVAQYFAMANTIWSKHCQQLVFLLFYMTICQSNCHCPRRPIGSSHQFFATNNVQCWNIFNMGFLACSFYVLSLIDCVHLLWTPWPYLKPPSRQARCHGCLKSTICSMCLEVFFMNARSLGMLIGGEVYVWEAGMSYIQMQL